MSFHPSMVQSPQALRADTASRRVTSRKEYILDKGGPMGCDESAGRRIGVLACLTRKGNNFPGLGPEMRRISIIFRGASYIWPGRVSSVAKIWLQYQAVVRSLGERVRLRRNVLLRLMGRLNGKFRENFRAARRTEWPDLLGHWPRRACSRGPRTRGSALCSTASTA